MGKKILNVSFLSLLALVLLVVFIRIRLAMTIYQVPQPQAILFLGGTLERIFKTVEFVEQYPELDIWVSSGERQSRWIKRHLETTTINLEKVHYDVCPVDTVTSFTCIVKVFQIQGIRHVYLLTSDYHLSRSMAIAFIVLGSRGIAFQPVSLPSTDGKTESWLVIGRDFLRSLLWLVTGKTGAVFKEN